MLFHLCKHRRWHYNSGNSFTLNGGSSCCRPGRLQLLNHASQKVQVQENELELDLGSHLRDGQKITEQRRESPTLGFPLHLEIQNGFFRHFAFCPHLIGCKRPAEKLEKQTISIQQVPANVVNIVCLLCVISEKVSHFERRILPCRMQTTAHFRHLFARLKASFLVS